MRERRTLSGSQLGVFVETARKHFADWFPEIHVLVFSGMRPGELHALRWKDVDLDRACINLQRAVWAGHEGATKTGDGREIALPVAVCDVLRARRQSKGAPEGNVLVFPNASGGHRFASALYKTLRLCSDVAGMPFRVTPQVLRRTFNTLMVEAGVNQVVLRSQMGHSSEAMTHRYAGVHIERKLEAVELIVAQAAVD